MPLPSLNQFDLWSLVSAPFGLALLRAMAFVVFGYFVARLAGAGLQGVVRRTSKYSYATLARRVGFATVLGVAIATALQEVGFDLTLVAGAAGVLTVALGFASQTSASNIISGLFVLTEGSLVVGDLIRIGTTTGHVVAIDLLSIKVRTVENLLVRVPNETLVKGEITNLTRFAIRRAPIQIKVAYDEDLRRVRQILLDVTEGYEKVLRDPEPSVTVEGFSDGGVDLELGAWFASRGFVDTKTELLIRVKEALDRASIEIAAPGSQLASVIGTRLAPRVPDA
jgi:small-conductance mechanosensitive channel